MSDANATAPLRSQAEETLGLALRHAEEGDLLRSGRALADAVKLLARLEEARGPASTSWAQGRLNAITRAMRGNPTENE